MFANIRSLAPTRCSLTRARAAWTMVGTLVIACAALPPVVLTWLDARSEGLAAPPDIKAYGWRLAAMLLMAGATVVWAARALGSRAGCWPRRILTAAGWFGIAGLVAVGLAIFAGVMILVVFGAAIIPLLLALVIASPMVLLPIIWLLDLAEDLRALHATGQVS